MLSGVIFSCKSGEENAAAAVEKEVIPQVRIQQVFATMPTTVWWQR